MNIAREESQEESIDMNPPPDCYGQHFSATKMAKPLLLFAVTFVLILSSTIGFALVSGEDISSAMWRSWTYGKDQSRRGRQPLPPPRTTKNRARACFRGAA